MLNRKRFTEFLAWLMRRIGVYGLLVYCLWGGVVVIYEHWMPMLWVIERGARNPVDIVCVIEPHVDNSSGAPSRNSRSVPMEPSRLDRCGYFGSIYLAYVFLPMAVWFVIRKRASRKSQASRKAGEIGQS